MTRINPLLLLGVLVFAVTACDQPAETKPTPNLPLVSTTKVQIQALEITEEAVGSLEGLIDPTVASEISAKVIKVYVSVGDKVKKGQLIADLDANDYNMQRREALTEVGRIEAQLKNQIKTIERNQALVDKNFISQNAADNDLAQLSVLKEQLAGAKARIKTIDYGSSKARIYSPSDGIIEKKVVDSGEFVRPGDPIVQIIGNQKLRAHIPVPEYIAEKLKPGLTIKLTTPTASNTVVTTVKEIKPLVIADNRAIDIIADIINQHGWQAGASINAQIILNKKDAVLVVPEQSVVLRPAGEVVYVIQNNVAHQTIVQTGERKVGLVEIISGLEAGVDVAVDGASYLTDKAKINVVQMSQ